MPALQMLLHALEDFREEYTNYEQILSYYELFYRRHFGKMEDLEHFLVSYATRHKNNYENIANYLTMIKYQKQLKVLERAYCRLYKILSRSPNAHERRSIRRQYFKYKRLHRTVRRNLRGLRKKIMEKEKELEEVAGTSTLQEQPLAPEKNKGQEPPASREEEEVPPSEENLTLGRQVKKAVTNRFQRIWISTRRFMRQACCLHPPPAP
ncbi:hypothetical protein XENTR_v10019197 [Xenopus tropicalis]|uniref:Uncharacterized protein LOC116412337 n=1 Tax=Xenopus tropicalis TaxID=8364 RepID=A0A8J1JZ97_XENTR|nr:uncharacterized protein LOC116412337 [Xenopus tropicalis]KAE8593565.1 hypothetical protein XENTR_v10019197 [Xenopus tropicalis]